MVAAVLAVCLTGIDAFTEALDRALFPPSSNPWWRLLEHWTVNTPCLLVFLLVLRKFHGHLDALLHLKPSDPLPNQSEAFSQSTLNLQRLLSSAPQLTNLFKGQLDESNKISGEYAMQSLAQISCVQMEASSLLHTLTEVRNKAAVMCNHAQTLIETSRQKLTNLNRYTSFRETEIRDEIETIKRIVALMKDLLPLTALIGKLSKQTRLLALNASIQAANDRTVGRSFVVVAGEMRKLAVQIDSASNQVDNVMRQVSQMIEEKLINMTSAQRIEAEKNGLHTLTASMTQISDTLESTVSGMDRLAKDTQVAVQTIFDAVLKAQELAQIQDISRQQVELVQHGLDLFGDRLNAASSSISGEEKDFGQSHSFEDIFRNLESKYAMQTQRTIHDKLVLGKLDEPGNREGIAELF